MNLAPLLAFNICLGLLNLFLFELLRSRGQSGIFPAVVSVFNFSTAAAIAFIAYTSV